MAERTGTASALDREIAAAQRRGAKAARTEPRAKAARYESETGRVVVDLTNGCTFAFPAEFGQGLEGATPAQLAAVEVLPGGSGLHWEELDADLSVPGLVAGIFGSRAWMARQLGLRGGSVSSEAKAAAARENGKKGGRPRKVEGLGVVEVPIPNASKEDRQAMVQGRRRTRKP